MLLCTLLLLAPGVAAEAPDPALQSLVLAERAFARASVEDGTREAFLAFLDDASVLFRPGPVDGRQWFESRPPAAGRLSWEPLFADLSRDGGLGYTTGPWQFLPAEGEPSYGHYVTLWRRPPGESWRVAADIGIRHPRPENMAGDLTFPEPSSATPNRSRADAPETRGLDGLTAADRGFSALALAEGAERAFREYGAEALRLYRDGAPPVVGRAPACQALAVSGERLRPEPAGAVVADSLDLGFVYGTLEIVPAEADLPARAGSFLRIWKFAEDGTWKLVLDVVVQHGPAPRDS